MTKWERPMLTGQPSRIPPEALAAVERVLAHRAGVVSEVVGQERWRSTTVEHQCRKAESHARYAILESGPLGDPLDDETGEHPSGPRWHLEALRA